MATTEHFYTGNGSTTTFAFTFPYLSNNAVKVELNNVLKTENTSGQTNNDYTISNTNIVFNSAPGSGVNVHIYRNTNVDSAQAVYAAGSSIRAADLNNNHTQLLYSAQEAGGQLIRQSDIKDGAINSTKIEDGTIVNADVNASAAIEGSKLQASSGSVAGSMSSANFTKLAGIETGATADQTNAEIKTAYEANSNTNAYTDTEKTFVNDITSTATELNVLDGIPTGVTATELGYVDGVTSGIQAQIDGKQPLDSELTELATMGSGTAGALADLNTAEVQTLDGITSSTAELNLLDGKSIVTTIGGSATDVQIPSAQAVNERIVEVVTEVGGFTPIANETSFPTTNPDINDGAGTIVSIKALASNLVSNGSGVATISNGAGSGNTVTINGLANSTTYAAGKGLLVETTTTLHTYTFHREVIDPTGVTNAQTLVNDFNDRYQVSGSAPSTHPDGSALGDGDLWFDTSANVMKVYDLGNTQYDAVTSVGDFKLLTVVPDGATSGSPTFNGSIVSYDFRDGSNTAAITSAGQLIVSLNGVIQKPNSGSYNASNEGFYLEGTNGIKFCTAPPSGSSLFVTQCGSAVGIGVPNDNSVTEAKLTSDSVSEAKLKVSNSPVNGYFLSAQSGNTGGLTWAQALTSNNQINSIYDSGNQALLASNAHVEVLGNRKFAFDRDTSNSNKIAFQAPSSQPNDLTFTLPAADGSANHYLSTNGSGVLSFGALNAAHLTGTLPAIDGSNLTGLQAGATGGNSGGNAVFWCNEQIVTHDFTIPSGKNAGSFGPITINNGVTVDVPSGRTWTIV